MLFVEFSLYLASRFVGKLEEMVFVKLELKKGLEGVKEFQVVTKMCQTKRLLDHSLNLVHLEEKHIHPIGELFFSGWGIKRAFSDLFRCRS